MLPTYNRAQFICRAIRSILAQSLDNIEIILIDDGSNDGTSELIPRFFPSEKRLVYLRNDENLGIQKALNVGLRAAQAPYIARIDDDDEWLDPLKLAKQKEFLDKNPDYVLVGTGAVIVDANGNELFRFLNPSSDHSIRRRFLFKNCFTHSSVMFRNDAALRFGGYDEKPEGRHVEDYDLWLKLGTVGKLANLPLYAVRLTLHPGTISSQNKVEQFQKSLALVRRHGKNYPFAPLAAAVVWVKLVLYRLLIILPPFLQRRISKIYKSA